jgi:hypothetical protein
VKGAAKCRRRDLVTALKFRKQRCSLSGEADPKACKAQIPGDKKLDLQQIAISEAAGLEDCEDYRNLTCETQCTN